MAVFCSVGFINSYGVFQEYYLQHQLANESGSTVAWLGGVSIFFIFFGSAISGPVMDISGPRVRMNTWSKDWTLMSRSCYALDR